MLTLWMSGWRARQDVEVYVASWSKVATISGTSQINHHDTTTPSHPPTTRTILTWFERLATDPLWRDPDKAISRRLAVGLLLNGSPSAQQRITGISVTHTRTVVSSTTVCTLFNTLTTNAANPSYLVFLWYGINARIQSICGQFRMKRHLWAETLLYTKDHAYCDNLVTVSIA